MKVSRLSLIAVLAVFLIASCNKNPTSLTSSQTNAEDSSESISESSTESEPEDISGRIDKDNWIKQINELECLDGNYRVAMENIYYDTPVIELFEHADNGWHMHSHYVNNPEVYYDDYAVEYDDAFYYFYRITNEGNNTKELCVSNPSEGNGYSDLKKEVYACHPGICFNELAYEEIKWTEDHYEAESSVGLFEYSNYGIIYKSTYEMKNIKLWFKNQKLSTYSLELTLKKYTDSTLDVTQEWVINGEFKDFGQVVITAPEINS